MARTARTWITVGVSTTLLVTLVPQLGFAQSDEKAVSTKKAAGIGALLGFALGGDPLWGAASGAALGAAGGMIANTVTDSNKKKKPGKEAEAARQDAMASQERDLAGREERLAKAEREMTEALQARDEAEAAIVDAIGRDNWEGYKALRGCQYDRAYALAKVGATSNDTYHRMASIWLEAMTAVDSKDQNKAQATFQSLAERDPEIDTVQQASIATDQAVLEMRGERREIGIGACS